MKIGFFGTPGIASYCLEHLIKKYEISFVVTNEDKPQGRHLHKGISAVKETALDHGLDILQPSSLKDKEAVEQIISYDADIYVVVAYGHIIPVEVFSHPRLGTINLHPSLLPKYRGAAPIQWALIDGERESGITVQRIDEKLDSGDIVLQEKFLLNENINSYDLYSLVLPKGADMLVKAIDGLENGDITPVPQNHDDATYCKKITTEISMIDWTLPALGVHNMIRGLNPKPVAWTNLNEKRVKIFQSIIPHDESLPGLKPGEIIKYNKKRLMVGTGTTPLEILFLQPENKKKMDALSFINGHRFDKTEYFK